MKAFLIGVGLMAFSVVLSLVDRPLSTQGQSEVLDRRAVVQNPSGQTVRELIRGRGTLRIAAFGSANMWGAGLENRFDALPYLLSDEVDNFAMFSAGPNYPAVCTQTMLGDDKVYDVIFLEYWLKASQGLPDLARRLRRRFPNALLFFVKLWTPLHARRKESEGSVDEVTFEEWRKTRFPYENYQVNDIVKALEEDQGYWYFPDHPEADLIINDARIEVDGYNIRILKKDSGKETLTFYLHFFNTINAHLSPMGHDFLATMAKKTIQNKLDGISGDALVEKAEMGDWGKGDSCHVWFTTGAYKSEVSPELVMTQYDTLMGKFALEVTAPGWLKVINPFEDERTLYMSFLANVEGYYPEATVSLGIPSAADGGSTPPQRLVPVIPPSELSVVVSFDNTTAVKSVDTPRTLAIGKIPPGETQVFITPEGTTVGDHYFRIVGVSLTDETVVPLEFGFGPQFNH
jgi:hypothetical protein